MSLMGFPRITEVLWYLGPFLVTGPVALLFSGVLWFMLLRHVYWSVRARLRGHEWPAGQRGLLSALGIPAAASLLLGGVHFYSAYCSTLYIALWWHIEPRRIAEIEVVRLQEERKLPVGPPVYVRDQKVLREGFRRLDDAKCYTRYRESFRDGYRLRIREVGAANFSERYLTVYRQSSQRGPVPLVIPHRGPRDEGTIREAGEYTSPGFAAWVAEVIDPLFAGRKN